MFQKPFRVKTQTAIKGSDRKKLRASVGASFSTLTADDLTLVIPAKDEMTVTKIYIHSGDTAVIFSVHKNPVFLELDRCLYPTVYTLWKFPHMMLTMTTWPQLLQKLLRGADLMLPGVIVKEEITPSTFKHISKGDSCAVKLNGNLAPVAVGKMLMSGSDMFDSGMRGKGVRMIHMLGDELWAFGDQSQPPHILDDTPLGLGDDTPPAPGDDGTGGEGGDGEEDKLVDSQVVVCDQISRLQVENSVAGCVQLDSEDDCELEAGTNSSDTAHVLCVEEVDQVLDMCFKCAVKASIKKSDLPILTSAFYRLHMLQYCPAGTNVDIKKSSYKKLSKFLKEKQKEGYITVKELSKGADSITSVDKSHLGLRNLTAVEVSHSDTVPEEGATAECFQPPEITEMFSIPSALIQLVKPYGYSKGSALTGQDLRAVITEYVRQNDLQDVNDKRQIQLDPHLADIVLNRGEGNTTHMAWEEVFSKVMNKTQPAFRVVYPGKPAVVSKGKIEPIKLTVEQRASNKKATLIDNLETFGIDPADLAHQVQVGVACSASVAPHPQKGKGMQVLIQGNQCKFVTDLLLEKYKVPRKYVTGLEKMPKNKKR